MKVVVVKEYIDKYTGKFYKIGEKLTIDDERFAEIQKKGMFLVDISDEVVQQETPVAPDEQGADQEQTEPVEQQETPEPLKKDKPAGRRSRVKKESEDK